MKLDSYTVLHRKDERGVIVDSKVFGPDDEIPEGFEIVEYSPIHAVREDDQAPVAESVLTPWANPMKPSFLVDPLPEEAVSDVEDAAEDDDLEDEPEMDEGSVLQARQQAGEELTEAEQEALAAFEAESDESGDSLPVPPRGGAGSGADVWAAYAAEHGVAIEEGANRDEIIAACEKAGVPVD